MDSCKEEGCEKPVHVKRERLCSMHYARLRRGYPKNPEWGRRHCSVEGCDRKYLASGLCQRHYHRKRNGQAENLPDRKSWKIEGTDWYLRPDGYVVRYPVTGILFQHREVMKEKLGRDLLEGENVHHINGIRHDNRPENLELWVTSQPKGQRPEDLVSWAKEILSLYGSS